jgi:hypothetical protein
MSDTDITKRPNPGAAERAHSIGRALTSIVPGGTELFSAIITPPLERRRDEWIESIARALKVLEEKFDGFKIEELSQSEQFVTTTLHASQVAIRSHQKEKLEALRNAVLNAALPSAPDEDIQLLFLNFIDILTPSHLRILKAADDPLAKLKGQDFPLASHDFKSNQGSVLLAALPEFWQRHDLFIQFLADLHNRGLVNRLQSDVKEDELFQSCTTRLGKQFLAFITSPIEEPETP